MEAEYFDAELFAKTVALFDSDKLGEAENAFRKAVLLCKKHGRRFGDVAGEVFGQGASFDAAEFERLKRDEAQHAGQLNQAAAEIERLRAIEKELRAELAGETPDGEHVIDLPGRLRQAWRFAQFRLLILTLAIGAGIAAAEHHSSMAGPLGFVCLFLFGAWSVAQFHKRGLAQMLLKWLVYGLVLLSGGVLADNTDAGSRPAVFVAMLVAALLLTLTKVSDWLGGKIRKHLWESDPVHVVRGWFL
jgi:hypothetical protein